MTNYDENAKGPFSDGGGEESFGLLLFMNGVLWRDHV